MDLSLNKRAEGSVYAWIYGLVSLFGLGLLYIVFNQVFKGYIVPIIKNMANASLASDPATLAEVIGGIDRYMMYFNMLPFVIFFIIVIYMVVAAIRKERLGEE